MPDAGEGLTEAEVLGWRVAVGDTVVVNQILLEVETAKAAVELPSPYAGVVVEVLAAPGDVVPVGQPIIRIEDGVRGAGRLAWTGGRRGCGREGPDHGPGRRVGSGTGVGRGHGVGRGYGSRNRNRTGRWRTDRRARRLRGQGGADAPAQAAPDAARGRPRRARPARRAGPTGPPGRPGARARAGDPTGQRPGARQATRPEAGTRPRRGPGPGAAHRARRDDHARRRLAGGRSPAGWGAATGRLRDPSGARRGRWRERGRSADTCRSDDGPGDDLIGLHRGPRHRVGRRRRDGDDLPDPGCAGPGGPGGLVHHAADLRRAGPGPCSSGPSERELQPRRDRREPARAPQRPPRDRRRLPPRADRPADRRRPGPGPAWHGRCPGPPDRDRPGGAVTPRGPARLHHHDHQRRRVRRGWGHADPEPG